MNHPGAALAVLAGAGLLPLSTVPAEEDAFTVDLSVPDGATAVWIDLESAEVAASLVTGYLDGAALDLQDTALGVTAIAEVSPGETVLGILTDEELDVDLYIAFTDESGNILSWQSSSEQLVPEIPDGEEGPEETPAPSPTPTTTPTPTDSGSPSAEPSPDPSGSPSPQEDGSTEPDPAGTTSESPPSAPQSEAAEDEEDEASGGLAATGAVIAWTVAGAAALLLAGAALAYAARARKGGAL
ncbi:hypothetical protein [Nesterenkonia alkaliphila]|uniref:LPXTG cell wall anchor domain-containing protein n=1 Tax=Nesterenkonia alkaliphila TaxID=1463631 RepID=A0A7K1UJU1_9MICC|nr:hypothetical protein [Nesterenkonia alkaliphila]MVT26592.1 hypothetical protein [Nesterenkonia alkaliphila]GFZ92064.1 hypothetical protein GCM10011359_21670 [Nesterenkonia alkaliphila]